MSTADIRVWVQAHSDSLPETLTDLAKFPIPFRREIFLAVSSDRKLRLWQEHFSQIVAEDSSLNHAQRELVAEAKALLPQLFSTSSNDPSWRTFFARVMPLFAHADAIRIFQTLGPPEPVGGLPLPPDAFPAG